MRTRTEESSQHDKLPAMTTIVGTEKIIAALAALALSLRCAAAESSAYPTRPVRIIVNLTPGGGVDAELPSLRSAT